MDAGHINDSEEKQLVPGYGTIAIGIVLEDNVKRRTKNGPPPLKIEGDITAKGRQRYVIYFPSACEKELPVGTAVMFEKREVRLKGLGRPRVKILVADDVRPFDPNEWHRKMKEMEEQPQEQKQD